MKNLNYILQIISQIRNTYQNIINFIQNTYQNYQIYKLVFIYFYIEEIYITLQFLFTILLLFNIILLKFIIIKYNINIIEITLSLFYHIKYIIYSYIFSNINLDSILLSVNLIPVEVNNEEYLGYGDDELLPIHDDPIELSRKNYSLPNDLNDIEVIDNVIKILPEYEEKIIQDYYSYLYILYVNSSIGEIDFITDKLTELIGYKKLIKNPDKFPSSMIYWINKHEELNNKNKYKKNIDYYLLDDILGKTDNWDDFMESDENNFNDIPTIFGSNVANISSSDSLNISNFTSIFVLIRKRYYWHIYFLIYFLIGLSLYSVLPANNLGEKLNLIIENNNLLYYIKWFWQTNYWKFQIANLKYILLEYTLQDLHFYITLFFKNILRYNFDITINTWNNCDYINLNEYYTLFVLWISPFPIIKKLKNIIWKPKDFIEINIKSEKTTKIEMPYNYETCEVLRQDWLPKTHEIKDLLFNFDVFNEELDFNFMVENVKAIPDSFLVFSDNESIDNKSTYSKKNISTFNSDRGTIAHTFIDFTKSEDEASICDLEHYFDSENEGSTCNSLESEFYENKINSDDSHKKINKWLSTMLLPLIITRINISKFIKLTSNFIKNSIKFIKVILLYLTPLFIGDISGWMMGTLVILDENIAEREEDEDEYDQKERKREERKLKRQIRKAKKWKELPVTPLQRLEAVYGKEKVALLGLRPSAVYDENIDPMTCLRTMETVRPSIKNYKIQERYNLMSDQIELGNDTFNSDHTDISKWWDRYPIEPLQSAKTHDEDIFYKYGIRDKKPSRWESFKNFFKNLFKLNYDEDPTKSKWFY